MNPNTNMMTRKYSPTTIGVGNDCTGGPECTELVIYRRGAWVESIHLTNAEVDWLRKELKRAVKNRKREN